MGFTLRHRGLVRPAGALLAAGLAVLGPAACSGGTAPAKSHPSPAASRTAGAAPSTAAPGNLDHAAGPAVARVQEYTPGGYRTSSVVSGEDWADAHSQRITEPLSGGHLFQIACSGSGAVSVRLSLAKGDSEERVRCGAKALSVPFDGRFVAVIDGSEPNSGAYAWRIVAHV